MGGTMTKMMRMDEVKAATGLGRTSIYALMAAGEFPSSRKLTDRAVAWRSDEVAAWIGSRAKTREPA
ncbi:helix-turn-helix transcriptional regulator [Candidatus Poriferisodalis sp.]|uniref:helix-turn-helix transcriptional regulator n=1 Tax=Candidatus Poriferisodalis sp. TaxID=3101277 RepID=UPI003B5B99B9